ncbi:MAG TPA: hypothetical protein VFY70_04070, partial [Thermomicrobiales bacterium]|nr:hypothetical protein [Thermomicrobiales bacterium]
AGTSSGMPWGQVSNPCMVRDLARKWAVLAHPAAKRERDTWTKQDLVPRTVVRAEQRGSVRVTGIVSERRVSARVGRQTRPRPADPPVWLCRGNADGGKPSRRGLAHGQTS